MALGFAPSWEVHPLPRLRDADLLVTLNTDIPALVGTTLTAEYERARGAWGYPDEMPAELAHNAVSASFAPDELKCLLHGEIDTWLAVDLRLP